MLVSMQARTHTIYVFLLVKFNIVLHCMNTLNHIGIMFLICVIMVFFLKYILIPNVAEKNILILVEEKKII
jgi:antibiotic biosynthesis monooxygenase (ABM) superfamily enzyme